MPDLKLQHASLTESNGHRHVEMVFADQPDLEQSEQYLALHIEVTEAKYPRLPEAQLEALQRARAVIDREIQAIDSIRGRAHPTEDWRK